MSMIGDNRHASLGPAGEKDDAYILGNLIIVLLRQFDRNLLLCIRPFGPLIGVETTMRELKGGTRGASSRGTHATNSIC